MPFREARRPWRPVLFSWYGFWQASRFCHFGHTRRSPARQTLMGARGPAPKPAATRVRRNRTSGARTFELDASSSVPALPDRYDLRTRTWWEAVKSSPMADEYAESDWQGLLAVAALLELWWVTADPKALAEWRVSCREYGLTPAPAKPGLESSRSLPRPVHAPLPPADQIKLLETHGRPDRGGRTRRARWSGLSREDWERAASSPPRPCGRWPRKAGARCDRPTRCRDGAGSAVYQR